jgi:hypothetical protein
MLSARREGSQMNPMNRYWDLEQCAWVVHEPAAEQPADVLPEQRADEAPAPAPASAQ